MKKSTLFFIVCFIAFPFRQQSYAQAGMTISPGKLYYKLPAGASATQKVVVVNPNDKALDIGVSVKDWNYDSLGNNQTFDAGVLKTTCADWVQVLPGSYFTLQPHEKRELSVVFSVPQAADKSVPVHNSMIFLTQLNPGDAKTADGTSIKVTVRMGIKLYHAFSQVEDRDMEVLNFRDVRGSDNNPDFLELKFKNSGKGWLEGSAKLELLNSQTGKKIKLKDIEFYSLPGDDRLLKINMPGDLAPGKYTATAIINYGNRDELKVVELEFAR